MWICRRSSWSLVRSSLDDGLSLLLLLPLLLLLLLLLFLPILAGDGNPDRENASEQPMQQRFTAVEEILP